MCLSERVNGCSGHKRELNGAGARGAGGERDVRDGESSLASVFNNTSTRKDTRKMLRISLALSLLTIGLPSGDAVKLSAQSFIKLTFHVQHAFKRLTSYKKHGTHQEDSDFTKMLGEVFFKHGEGEGNGNSLVEDDIETLPYEVLKTYEVYDS